MLKEIWQGEVSGRNFLMHFGSIDWVPFLPEHHVNVTILTNHKMWLQNYFDTWYNKTVTSSASLSYFGNVIFPLFGPLSQVLREWFATIRAPLCTTWFNKEGVIGQ